MNTTTTAHEELTPRTVVAELDKFIVGQNAAKRVVAIALRNRTRRRRLDAALQEEVSPKNIIMIGPTGVGKTEIARRLARLVRAPFVKVEATKYTEVGYVGRDVESMVRDLVETAVNMVRAEMMESLRPEAEARARERLLDLLMPSMYVGKARQGETPGGRRFVVGYEGDDVVVEDPEAQAQPADGGGDPVRAKLEKLLDGGHLEDREIEMEVTQRTAIDGMFGMVGIDEQTMGGMRDMMERIMPQKRKATRLPVSDARKILLDEQFEELLDDEKVNRIALERAEQDGLIFIDELDKVAGRTSGQGPDVSREGVQRDILPIVEGCSVYTKYGSLRTDHILFIAAGAFHMAKPSDLIPELQGRFPLRVELEPLGKDDFKRILVEPECSLVRQYRELMATDGVELEFTDDAIDELAAAAMHINDQTENIGARRLHSVLERVLESAAFDAPDALEGKVTIDRDYVRDRLRELLENQDLSRFIL